MDDCVSPAALGEYIHTLKVASLKELIKLFNERLPYSAPIRLSGNKADLVERLVSFIESTARVPRNYLEVLSVMGPVGLFAWLEDMQKLRRATDQFVHIYGHAPSAGTSLQGRQAAAASAAAAAAAAAAAPHPPPVHPPAPRVPPPRPTALQRLRFWRSPFYEPLEYVSSVVQVPEAPPPSGRRQVVVAFSLAQQHKELLQDTHKYQLRLFATTFEQYMASVSVADHAAPVDFPYTCEARVNERPLGVSLRGSKKHAGCVSPPDLNRNGSITLLPGRLNRVELMYANTTSRYILVVALCRITHADALADSLKQKHFRTHTEVVERMRHSAQDDDIQTGASTLRLTCPLTYMRMKMPCRADACDHVQCFDALSFFSMNEQSPQWRCPVCHQFVAVDDLRVDGYVENILQRTPADLEAVLVESDGSWHSADNVYNSETAVVLPPPPEADEVSDAMSTPPAKAEHLTPDVDMGAAAAAPPSPPPDVIDLTFSSDEN